MIVTEPFIHMVVSQYTTRLFHQYLDFCVHYSGTDRGFCDRGGLEIIIVHSGSMGVIVPNRTANSALLLGVSGTKIVSPRKFLRLKFSEIQSSAFGRLNLAILNI